MKRINDDGFVFYEMTRKHNGVDILDSKAPNFIIDFDVIGKYTDNEKIPQKNMNCYLFINDCVKYEKIC